MLFVNPKIYPHTYLFENLGNSVKTRIFVTSMKLCAFLSDVSKFPHGKYFNINPVQSIVKDIKGYNYIKEAHYYLTKDTIHDLCNKRYPWTL